MDIVASLTNLPVATQIIDVAVALHVLEHIRDDRKAMTEVARVLIPNGAAVLQAPLSGRPTTDEELLDSAEERSARYGQADHVRIYGDDFFTRSASVGLEWIAVSPRQSMLPETINKYGLLPDEALVFTVRSNSMVAAERLEVFGSMLRKGSLRGRAIEEQGRHTDRTASDL